MSNPDQTAEIEACLSGADLLLRSGDPVSAFAILEELRSILPHNVTVLAALGRAYHDAAVTEKFENILQDLATLAQEAWSAEKWDEALQALKVQNKFRPSVAGYANMAFLRTLKANQILTAS